MHATSSAFIATRSMPTVSCLVHVESDLNLCPHAVGAGNKHWRLIIFFVDLKASAEKPYLAQDAFDIGWS